MRGADDSGVVAIGTVLAGRYRIDGVLGTGGMGRVYRGEHATIGKAVAVKVLHAALGHNQEAATRFQREAIASGRLDHPNIVSVMDFGVLDDGCLYLVMEALEGEHLGQRIARDKRLPWREALTILRSVLLGLHHAHDRGVVHRDIKPDNVFLAVKDGQTVVKVLDFGIAKLYMGDSDDLAATRAGITVGTPTYLSPEQATGGAITPASDIYSASVVLYEMLVGRAPFESEDPLVLLTAHVGGQVPTFSELAPHVEVPAAVEALVRRGLTKLVADRIGSIEYVEAIERILDETSSDVVPASLTVRASQSIGVILDSLTTPTPAPTKSVEAAVPQVSAAQSAQPAAPPSRRLWLAFAIIALLGAPAAAYIVFVRAADRRAFADTPAPPASSNVPAPPPPRTTDEHQTQLKLALHDLQDGATCNDRKKAVARLVELADANAVPSLKKARARSKVNACLRMAADQAIKKLDGRI